MHLVETKSLLAKLMATENLIVEQRKVETASFDVKSRVLTIPQLDDNISGYLFDLFISHEVGHALYTPIEGLKETYELGISSIANLVEDSRIERKIKNKYPGVRNSFVRGYKELIEKDFFGTKGADLNTLPFLDRLNLFEKGGASQGITFNEKERHLLNLVQSTETYDDVIEVSKLIASYSKEEKALLEMKIKSSGLDEEEGDNFDSEEMDYDSVEMEFDSEWEDNEDEGDSSISKSLTDDGEDENDEKSPSVTTSMQDRLTLNDKEEIRSLTNDAFQDNQKKLFATSGSQYCYADLPKFNLDEVLHDYKEVYKAYNQERVGYWGGDKVDTKIFTKFRIEANKIASYLAKEFEMRKNAEQMKRASVAKTGELNMNKIYSYKFNEDIFKKITVMPGGKSHGLVMFIDWSGSMSNHLHNTVKQLLSLVLFCKKVNIPYEVYAFSSEWKSTRKYPVEGEVATDNFSLLNLLSNRMSAVEFTEAASILLESSSSRYAFRGNVFSMGGTPLNETIIAAMDIIPEFQKKYKLQIVNTVFLTDGQGRPLSRAYRKTGYGLRESVGEFGNEFHLDNESSRLIVRDPKTKYQVILPDNYDAIKNTACYLELLKNRTGSNIVGFYVLAGRDFGREAYKLFPRAVNFEEMKLRFRKEKSMVVTSAGFDEYYLLRSENLDTEEDTEFEVKENATVRGLVSAFSKYTKNRLASRVILNRFIGMVA